MKRLSFLSLAVFAYVTCAVPIARADTISPGGLAGVEGNTNNSFPFNINPIVSGGTQHYQQVYSAADFTGPVLISGIAFRPDATFGAPFLGTVNVQIGLSTTTRAVDGLSPLFGLNIGADVVTVVNGSISLSSAFTGPVGGPKDFDIVIPFTTPFSYNPALGNLLLDILNLGGTDLRPFDAQNIMGDSVSRVFTSCFGGVCSGTGPSGVLSTVGLVTKFSTITPIPEPSSFVLLAAGLTGFAVVRVRKRQAK